MTKPLLIIASTLIFGGLATAIIIKESQRTIYQQQGIITLSPAQSQMLDYIGLGKNIAVVSAFEKDPKFKQLPKIKGGLYFDPEDLLLHPNKLILLPKSSQSPDLLAFLVKHQLNYISTVCNSFQDIYDNMTNVAQHFSKDANWDKIKQFKEKFSQIQPQNKKALILISFSPFYSASSSSYLTKFIQTQGWDNVLSNENVYPLLTEEDLIQLKNIDSIWLLHKEMNKEEKIVTFLKKHVSSNIYFYPEIAELPTPYLLK